MSTQTDQKNETAITAKQDTSVRGLISGDAFRKQVALALPRHLTPERFTRVALTAINRTPKLADCTRESLFQCLLDLSALGLEPDGRRAHLIPYGNTCTLIIDYKGLVELVMRSGEVSSIHADVVCEEDKFTYDLGEIKKHTINFKAPRGLPYAAYCIVRMKDGTTKCEVMHRDEVEHIRNRSRAGKSGPWVTDWNEMAKKTVFRRCSKWLPFSPEIREAMEKDDEQVIDVAPISETPRPLFRKREEKQAEATTTTAEAASSEETKEAAS